MGRATATAAFSLLEMMLVLAIMAILSVLLVPSYQQHLHATRRAEAKVALQELRHAMEEHYSRHHSYRGAARSGDQGEPLWGPAGVPAQGEPRYRLRIERADAHSYLLAAIPVDGGAQSQQHCGRITLDDSGQWNSGEEGC